MKAILITRDESGQHARLSEMDDSALPGPEAGGEVLVDVDYSTINYKDGLALTGKAPVVRSFPMVPGIDFAGTVRESSSTQWKRGDAVILNGWGVGESHWGGLAQRARVRADWLIRRPAGMDARTTMALGWLPAPVAALAAWLYHCCRAWASGSWPARGERARRPTSPPWARPR